jgi:cell shape-determining protein MreD
MAHFPINHPARPIYRAVGALIGVYLVLFGILGFFVHDKVFGQGTNAANSAVSVVIGLVVLGATVLGRNLDVTVYKVVGYALMALGLLTLAFLRTDGNFLNHSITTSIVWMVLGITLLLAGMYIKVGSTDDVTAWKHARLTE